jgi:hypothetical protein
MVVTQLYFSEAFGGSYAETVVGWIAIYVAIYAVSAVAGDMALVPEVKYKVVLGQMIAVRDR